MLRCFSLLLASLTLGLLGCGSGEGTVSGTVKVDGKLLDNGTVTFHPISGGPAAVGSIDSNGAYTLKVGTSTSIKPGEYTVTVFAAEITKGSAKEAPKAGKSLVPEKYTQPKTSDLKKTVAAGSNTIELELRSGK